MNESDSQVFHPESFRIDPSRPLYEQYVEQIRARIACRQLLPGTRLPSVRDFAAVMRINPTTAARTYQELERDHLLETFRGQGTYVTRDTAQIAAARKAIAQAAVRELHEVAESLGLSVRGLLELAEWEE
ncbi:GntR family transcriptional regulator [Gorillibacterium sp. sgz5001074]|uniref:GntR family transcriptional regulator n=1 Tax=Gorillibacterium sp. sgz5001074 TaxID=3446695 RepID=UPI003F665139